MEGCFVTVGRKDDYSYLWDSRNLATFVETHRHQRKGNQRTGLLVTHNYVFMGGEEGEIFCHGLKGGETSTWYSSSRECISSICLGDPSTLLFTQGSRSFEDSPSLGGLVSVELTH